MFWEKPCGQLQQYSTKGASAATQAIARQNPTDCPEAGADHGIAPCKYGAGVWVCKPPRLRKIQFPGQLLAWHDY